jgi:DNA topoisomerase-3
MGSDEKRIYDMVAKRFLAIFHPEAVFERTRVETTVAEHVFRTSGRRLLQAGWKAVYGAEADSPEGADDDTGGDQLLPRLEQGEQADVKDVESMRKETQPPRRFTDASLLGAMETAGKDIDDVEVREAMKDSGIGTPATRAAIIERLIDVGYIEREGRALVATEKGVQVIRLLGEHPLTSPALTGDWERRLGKIEHGGDSRPKFMDDIATFTRQTVEELDKLKDVKIERQNLGPCPICGRDVMENRKGYSCWSKDDPGCGFVIWKKKAGKNLPVSVVKELMDSLRASRERGDHPPIGRTAKPVTGFRGRSGRTFRAKLRLEQADDDKWRVEFDEDWAKEPPKDQGEGEAQDAAASAERQPEPQTAS